MGIQERRQIQQEQQRAMILEESWRIVESEGWNALSIRRIADAIKYSIPVVYRHFSSKDDLVLVFTKQGYGLLERQLSLAGQQSADPRENLRYIARAYAKFAYEHSRFYQLMFGLGMPTCEQLQDVEEMKRVGDIIAGGVSDVIESTQVNKLCPPEDLHLKGRTFWSLLHGLMAMNVVSEIGCTEENKRLLDDAIEGFIQSVVS